MFARSVRRFSKRLDFRSDTVTKPCQKMKKAIESSIDMDILGDDIYKDCPITNSLE